MGAEGVGHLGAALGGDLLRVVEPAVAEAVGQDDGGGGDRPGQGAAPGLVDPGDEAVALLAQGQFVVKTTAPTRGPDLEEVGLGRRRGGEGKRVPRSGLRSRGLGVHGIALD